MGAPNQQNTRAEGPSGLFKLQKIITRKISIVSKNVTYKKMPRISFSIENKKRGYKIEGLDLEKFRCFQISKNHNSVNFCFRQKSYLEKMFGASFSIEKKFKNLKIEKKNFWEFSKNHNS